LKLRNNSQHITVRQIQHREKNKSGFWHYQKGNETKEFQRNPIS
jgi:hypothetical protein